MSDKVHYVSHSDDKYADPLIFLFLLNKIQRRLISAWSQLIFSS